LRETFQHAANVHGNITTMKTKQDSTKRSSIQYEHGVSFDALMVLYRAALVVEGGGVKQKWRKGWLVTTTNDNSTV